MNNVNIRKNHSTNKSGPAGMNDLAAIRPYSGAGAKTAGAPAARRGKPPDALGVAVILCKGPADHLAAKLPPTLWGQPPARAARGCAAGGSRRLPRRHPTGSPCTWRVATLATPSAGCNQQVRAGRNGSAPIRCPGTSIHLSAVVVRVRGAGRRGLLLCINNVTTPPAS